VPPSSAPVVGAFCADVHSRRCAWASRPNLCGDSAYAIEQVVDAAVEHRVPLVVAGDLLDEPKPEAEAVVAWFRPWPG
jgi:DNA repair exonuclease SbcCD nuclease subunit